VSPLPSRSTVAHGVRPIPAKAGVGLRFPHHDYVLSNRPDIAWLEVHPENYLGHGIASEILSDVHADYPLSFHATGLSLGSANGVNADHLSALSELCRRVGPALISDHLSWSAVPGVHLPDLLPIPYTSEALKIFARNVDHVQSVLRRRILVENPSVYVAFAEQDMGEGEFLHALVQRTGCGVLLDINNIAVSASNMGIDARDCLAQILSAIHAEAIGEIHLAGHAEKRLPDGNTLRIDDHGSAVSDDVWFLYETAIQAIGPRPTLIEWDTDIPAFEVLEGEASKADAILSRCSKDTFARELADAAAG
jgi:uncharacterized protein